MSYEDYLEMKKTQNVNENLARKEERKVDANEFANVKNKVTVEEDFLVMGGAKAKRNRKKEDAVASKPAVELRFRVAGPDDEQGRGRGGRGEGRGGRGEGRGGRGEGRVGRGEGRGGRGEGRVGRGEGRGGRGEGRGGRGEGRGGRGEGRGGRGEGRGGRGGRGEGRGGRGEGRGRGRGGRSEVNFLDQSAFPTLG
jgi:hypothetical protein